MSEEPKKIMVVDDEPDIVEFMTDLLEEQGYKVASAQDGLKAMEVFDEFHPDLILLDIQMPNETGVGFYRKLFRKHETENLPIFVISGMPGRRWSINNRVPVFDKPIDEAKLLEEIKRVFNE